MKRSRRIEPWSKVEPHRVSVKPWPSDSYPECPWTVTPVKPRKRDFWKVLLGRYTPELRVGRVHSFRMATDAMREVWTPDVLKHLGRGRILMEIPE